jgi:DNA end-binding protein Ku
MRAIWKGAVSFGLVNVPVRLYSATENHDVQFRQVHREDGGRIKYQRVCSIDGEQVSYDDIAKGYETEDGQMVVLTDEDLADLPTRSSREIAVEKFVPADQIDPMYFDKSYYLEPDKTAAKPYGLLRDALKSADRMAIVTVSLRARMTVAVLRVHEDVIVMQTMLWPDEIRAADFGSLREVSDTKPAELAMANMLVESLAGDFVPDEYEDDYQAAVEAVVKAKLEGGEVKERPVAKETGGEVVDLLGALQRSVERAKASRGEPTSGGSQEPEEDTSEADLAPEEPAGKTSAKGARASRAGSNGSGANGSRTKKASARAAKASGGTGSGGNGSGSKASGTKGSAANGSGAKKTAKKTAEKPAKKATARKRVAS